MIEKENKNKKITPEQKRILDSNSAVRRVIACAGSGKTFVLTQNIVDILRSGMCRPEEILAITFTKNAAENMRSKIKASLAKKIDFSAINIYTFNSFGNLIISENSFLLGLGKDYRLINISKSWQMIYEIVKKSDFKSIPVGKDTGKFTEDVLHYIRDLKSNLILPSDLKSYYSEREKIFTSFSSAALLKEELEIFNYQADLCSVYENYEYKKHENNLVDYYDHIFLPYLLLKDNDEIREKYRRRYKYIFIDEFQDTDIAQGYFISMLYKPDYNSLMIVGDDDQGIYSFRGACIENILDFHNWDAFKDYTVKDYFLTTNFRSGEAIIEAINNLISFNEGRFGKDLKPEYKNKKSEVLFSVFDSPSDEARQIALNIRELNLSGFKLKDIAVLARKKRFKYIVEALEKQGLKYEVVSGKGFFYEPEVLYIISWLMAVADIQDEIHLIYLLQSQKYKISDRDVYFMKNFDTENKKLPDAVGSFHISLFDGITESENNPYLKKETKLRLKEFIEEMNHYVSQSFSVKLNELISIIYEYSGLYCELKSGFNKTRKRKIKNIELLIKISSDFESESMENNLEGFIVYLKDVAKSEEEDPESIQFRQSDAVKIMSIHASKGLEFEAVFLPMLWKNDYNPRTASGKFKIPAMLRKDRKIYGQKHSFKSKEKFESEIKKLNMEEERRIFYVACSRAKKLLFLSYSEQDSGPNSSGPNNAAASSSDPDKKPKIPLPFLEDILKKNGDRSKIRILNEKAYNFLKKILPESVQTEQAGICTEDLSQILSDNYTLDDAYDNSGKVLKNSKKGISGSLSDPVCAAGIEKILAGAVNGLKASGYNSSGSCREYKKMIDSLKYPAGALSRAEPAQAKKNFSMTELLGYLECPRKYKWKYIYNIPEPSGRAILTGEKVHKFIQVLTMQSFGEIVDKNFLAKAKYSQPEDLRPEHSKPGGSKTGDSQPEGSQTQNSQAQVSQPEDLQTEDSQIKVTQTADLQTLRSDGSQVDAFLNNYIKSCFYSDPDVKKIILEQLFYWNLKGFVISCKVDRLDYMSDGSLRIIDYKTSALKGNKPAVNYLNQLKSYTGGISSLFSILPKQIKAFLFYLKDGKICEKNYEAAEISRFENSLVNACERINSNFFPKKLRSSCSENCYYFKICAKNNFSRDMGN